MLFFGLICSLLRQLYNTLSFPSEDIYLSKERLNGEELFLGNENCVQVVLDAFLQLLLSVWIKAVMERALPLIRLADQCD